MQGLISFIILPLLSALIILVFPKKPWLSCFSACIPVGLSFWVLAMVHRHGVYHETYLTWSWLSQGMTMLHGTWSLGVDGLSVWLIALTTWSMLWIAWHAVSYPDPSSHQFQALSFLAHACVLMLFLAQDALTFYIGWEALLIPMMLQIVRWGSEERQYAAQKFFLFTFLASAPLLIMMIAMAHHTGTLSLEHWFKVKLSFSMQCAWLAAFLLAFGVKVPMIPMHVWLPDAHTQAPTGGSVLLASLLLKVGIYGLLKFAPLVPDAVYVWSPFIIGLSVFTICYIGWVAVMQSDMKRLIAYSSIAHMGFCTLGFSLPYAYAPFDVSAHGALMSLEGVLFLMLSHACSTGGLFFCVGILQKKLKTRNIHAISGLAKPMPRLATLFMVFSMANIGLPGTSGFVGEFLIILATFQQSLGFGIMCATTVILSAIYTLWLYKRVFWGNGKKHSHVSDITTTETLLLGSMAFFIVVMGLWPDSILRWMHGSAIAWLHSALLSKFLL
jgi:NADH-quinone oxidoreductase subunit M